MIEHLLTYSCNKIATTQIQLKLLFLKYWSSDKDLTNSTSFYSKNRWYKKVKKFKLALNSQLLTVQILTNNVQELILCLSYFITTVPAS